MIKTFNNYSINEENSPENHSLPYKKEYPFICVDDKGVERYVILIDFESKRLTALSEEGWKYSNVYFNDVEIKRFVLETNEDGPIYKKVDFN